VSFFLFGAVLLGPALQQLRWQPLVYAVLSLTVVRLLPVALALAGSRLAVPTVAYIGWFGPRGLASIVLGLLVVEAGPPHVGLTGDAVALTVGLSVLLHGATSVPLAARYGRWYEAAVRRRPGIPEAGPGGAGPPRRVPRAAAAEDSAGPTTTPLQP
jgi:NhaP-type Na+/H+ or K+/H+ antiporter